MSMNEGDQCEKRSTSRGRPVDVVLSQSLWLVLADTEEAEETVNSVLDY